MTITIISLILVSFLVAQLKLQKNFKLKIRSKFNSDQNLSMALRIMVIYTVLFEKLYTILKKKRDQKARDNQFLFQNITVSFLMLKQLN